MKRLGQFDLVFGKCECWLHGPESYAQRREEPCARIGTILVCHDCINEYGLDWEEALVAMVERDRRVLPFIPEGIDVS